jgi:hypothetical protein
LLLAKQAFTCFHGPAIAFRQVQTKKIGPLDEKTAVNHLSL